MFRHRPYLPAILGLAVLLAALPAHAGEDAYKYLPADTELVSTLNFRQMLESDLARNNKGQVELLKGLVNNAIQTNDFAEKYLKSLGIDLFRDFNSVTVAAAASANPEKVLLILDGKFNAEKFQKTAEDAAREYGDILKIVKVGNHTVWEVSHPNQDKTLYVALANKTTLLATLGKTTMTDALAQAAGTREPALKKEVREILKMASGKQSFSFVFGGTGKGLSKAFEMAAAGAKDAKMQMGFRGAATVVKDLVGAGLTITLTKEIQIQLGIETENKKQAEERAGQITGGIFLLRGLVAQAAQADPKAELGLDIVKTFQTSVEGTTVLVRGRISEAVLEKAMKHAGQGQ